jgi:hypothetical protein
MHLKHITRMYSNGDFSIPMFVHSEIPPGVAEMKDKRADIAYIFEELPTGGSVNYKLGMILGVSMFLGALLGRQVAMRLPAVWLRRIFILAVIGLAAKMLLAVLR